jgi:hypothetical protein
MTELHNMCVPSRSVLTVQRETLPGRRYAIVLRPSAVKREACLDDVALTRCFREEGAACALALLHAREIPKRVTFQEEIARFRDDPQSVVRLGRRCARALRRLRLPDGFGFFVEDTATPGDRTLSGAAAIAILAARSGPLYLPGRFEPSLITVGPVTLFFPVFQEAEGVE